MTIHADRLLIAAGLLIVSVGCQPQKPPPAATQLTDSRPNVPVAGAFAPLSTQPAATNPSASQTSSDSAAPPTLALPLNRPCRVHLRRDALGLSSAAPLGFAGDNIPGRNTILSGTLIETSPDWLLVRSGDHDYYIPRSMVLLVEFQERKP